MKDYIWIPGETGEGFLVKAPKNAGAGAELLDRIAAWGAAADAAMAGVPKELDWNGDDFRYVGLSKPVLGGGAVFFDSGAPDVDGSESLDEFDEFSMNRLNAGAAAALCRLAGIQMKKAKDAVMETIHVCPGGKCELELMAKDGEAAYVPVEALAAMLRDIHAERQAEKESSGPRP